MNAEFIFRSGGLTRLRYPGVVAEYEPPAPAPAEARSNGGGFKTERERFEREQLVRALAAADGNKAEAARALGIARSTLVSRLKKLGLS